MLNEDICRIIQPLERLTYADVDKEGEPSADGYLLSSSGVIKVDKAVIIEFGCFHTIRPGRRRHVVREDTEESYIFAHGAPPDLIHCSFRKMSWTGTEVFRGRDRDSGSSQR